MATASVAFKSREDHRKQMELEEARKAGLAPPEVDEDGKEINPHIPHYMSSAPWYLSLNSETPSLKHQRKRKSDPNYTKSSKSSWYDRGSKIYQADKYRKGACENCGAMPHTSKTCTERPRKLGAKLTNKSIAPDEKIETFDLDYDGKRDRWNGYDAAWYAVDVIERYEARDEARKKYLKEQEFKKFKLEVEEEDNEDEGLKVDESKQMEFAKVEKRVRTSTGGGSTGSVRNLRIREDTAKYLVNLDVNSAHYDPKTRSMREDPLPNHMDHDPSEKLYSGDNRNRVSGQALEFKQLKMHAWEAGNDVHVQAAPSQAELLYKNYKINKEKLKETIVDKYGNAATEEALPRELLLGQTEREIEYDRAGRIIKGQEIALIPKSKYEEEEEDVHINNHTTVWGSWWKDHQWGYNCCRQFVRNSYCTGAAGIED